MKILFLSHHFGESTACGITSSRLADSLSDLGHEVIVISSNHIGKTKWKKGKHFTCSDFPSRPSRLFTMISDVFQHDCREIFLENRMLRLARNVIKEYRPDFIFAKALPVMICKVGGILSKEFSIPVIMHFTDPVPLPKEWTPDLRQRQYEKKLMSEIMPYATAISFGNEYMLKYHKLNYNFSTDYFILPDLCATTKLCYSVPQNRKIKKLVYFGSFYGHRYPLNLFKAVEQLNNEGCYCELLIYSQPTKNSYKSEFIKYLGRTSEVNSVLSKADVLIDLDADDQIPVFISSKIKDYLRFTVPILSITPQNSPTENLVTGLSTIKISRNVITEIKKALIDILDYNYSNSNYEERKTILSQFDSSRVANDLISKMRYYLARK